MGDDKPPANKIFEMASEVLRKCAPDTLKFEGLAESGRFLDEEAIYVDGNYGEFSPQKPTNIHIYGLFGLSHPVIEKPDLMEEIMDKSEGFYQIKMNERKSIINLLVNGDSPFDLIQIRDLGMHERDHRKYISNQVYHKILSENEPKFYHPGPWIKRLDDLYKSIHV